MACRGRGRKGVEKETRNITGQATLPPKVKDKWQPVIKLRTANSQAREVFWLSRFVLLTALAHA